MRFWHKPCFLKIIVSHYAGVSCTPLLSLEISVARRFISQALSVVCSKSVQCYRHVDNRVVSTVSAEQLIMFWFKQ